MNRRSTPSATRDDDAFPIRIKLAVPPDGLGKDLDAMMAWLREHLTSRHAVHSARTIGGSAMAVYFTSLADAAAFLEAFPDMPLAMPPGW
jgi:hypothetical protein